MLITFIDLEMSFDKIKSDFLNFSSQYNDQDLVVMISYISVLTKEIRAKDIVSKYNSSKLNLFFHLFNCK